MYSSLEGRAQNCQWQCKQQIKFLLSKPSYLCLGRTVCMQRDYLVSAVQSLPSKRVSSQHPNRYFAISGSVCKAWITAHAEQNQLAVIPQLLYRYYKQGYINFLAQYENFSSSSLRRPQREDRKFRRKWSANTMKKQGCCTDAAGAGNMSLSGEAWRNEMVLMAILSLKPLLTATSTATGVTILGRTESTVCPGDPYLAQALGNISATAS